MAHHGTEGVVAGAGACRGTGHEARLDWMPAWPVTLRLTLMTLCLSARPHVSQSSRTVPHAGDQMFKHVSVCVWWGGGGEASYSSHHKRNSVGPKTYSMAAVGPTASPKVSEEQRTRQGSQWGALLPVGSQHSSRF